MWGISRRTCIGSIAIVVLVMVLLGILLYANWLQPHHDTITVKRLYIDPEEGETNYMVVATDGRIFQMDYVYVKGQWSIDKEWAELEVNGTYRIHYCGWDIHNPLWDEYPTIYRVERQEG